MNNYTVYMHKNKINNKVYIGQTCQKPIKRWDNGRGYNSSPRFYNAILKYGWDNFEHTILYTNLTLDEANNIEKILIQLFNSTDENFGYNITSGGHNFQHSEETKKKISMANHISQQGRCCPEEQRILLSKMFSNEGNPFFGKHHTEETKRLISEHRKGKRIGEDHPLFGKHHTEETKRLISENRKNKGGKIVECINTSMTFNTAAEAARWCGLSNGSTINQICNGNTKRKTAGKHPISGEPLRWRYYIEEK